MKIVHLAMWVKDIEKMRLFYTKYFNAKSEEKYENKKNNFSSYFLSFETECRLEIMQMLSIEENKNDPYKQYMGLIHFAISVGSKESVDKITELLKNDGYELVSSPRTTGDGYYESAVLDPEKNRIEITI